MANPAPDVTVAGSWVSGGLGIINPFENSTNSQGLVFEPGLAAPAIWKFSWVAGNPTRCDGSTPENAPVTSLGTVVLVCLSSGVGVGSEFSISPNTVYAPAAPSSAACYQQRIPVATYGMPLVQYYSPNGTLVAQETATSVSSDGTSIQISPSSIDFSTLPAGIYAGVISNAGPDSTWQYVGDTAVNLLTPSVSIIGALRQSGGDIGSDSGTISVTVNGQTETVSYGDSEAATTSDVSSAVSSAFNSDSGSTFAALSSGEIHTDLTFDLWLTNKASSSTAMTISANSPFSGSGYFQGLPSFIAIPSQSVIGSGSVTIVGAQIGDEEDGFSGATVSVTVNGLTESASSDSNQDTASALASAFNSDPNSPVSASVATGPDGVTRNVLNLTSNVGSNTPLAISVGADVNPGPDPAAYMSFIPLPAGVASGTATVTILGSSQGDWTDGWAGGTVYITVNGITESYTFGGGEFNTAIASSLASSFNSDSSSPVTASASANVITLTSKSGSSGSLVVSVSANGEGYYYGGAPSFIPVISGH